MKLLKKIFGTKHSISEHADVERCASCGRMKIKGSQLEFISRIERDGFGITPIIGSIDHLNDTIFTLNCLSGTKETYIACEFNSYVVKFKK